MRCPQKWSGSNPTGCEVCREACRNESSALDHGLPNQLLTETPSCEAGHVTAPDQSAAGGRQALPIYMEGGLVTNPGWQQDGIEAKLRLLIKDDRTVDLISKGAPPNDFKYSEHGCQVERLPLPTEKTELVLLAIYSAAPARRLRAVLFLCKAFAGRSQLGAPTCQKTSIPRFSPSPRCGGWSEDVKIYTELDDLDVLLDPQGTDGAAYIVDKCYTVGPEPLPFTSASNASFSLPVAMGTSLPSPSVSCWSTQV